MTWWTDRMRLLALTGLAVLLGPNRIMRGSDGPSETPPAQSVETVKYVASPRVLLSYEMDPDSAPVTKVELWYTMDRGKSWRCAPGLTERTDQIIFDADQDALYGFFIVLHNEAGASSPPPSAGAAPQQWVRVDRTAPAVQALGIRPDPRFDSNREVHLRWSSSDDNLPDRPVALHYRTEQTKTFQLIADCLAARSAYKWVVPPEVSGRVEIKISATDRAGNTGTYLAEPIRIEPSRSQNAKTPKSQNEPNPTASPAQDEAMGVRRETSKAPGAPAAERVDLAALKNAAYGEPDAGVDAQAGAASREAREKYDTGTWHRLRGDHAQAEARYKEAVALDPKLLSARCDLAGVLLLRGEAQTAERELHGVLEIDPTYRPALKGLALIQAKRRNYQSARQTLDKVLLLAPGDPEAWLAFGDVVMFTGDRVSARRAWIKAAALGEASDVKDRANRRLDLYPDESKHADNKK